VVGLLCIKQAKEGGLSSWASSITAHNEILRRGRRDLAEVLAQRGVWFLDRKGEIPPGEKPYFEQPIFNYHEVLAYLRRHLTERSIK
jgi:Taurine catabolism dioxygenase TauD, TfdA family